MSIRNGKRLIIIPIGVTVEVAKGFLVYASPSSAVIGVYLDDGKFMDAKRNVINVLKVAANGIGADFYEYGVKPGEYELTSLLRLLDELKPSELYLETVTGPRLLSILLIKLLHEYAMARGIKSYLILGVEGEGVISVISVKSLFTLTKDLGPLQKKTLLLLAKKKEANVDEIAKAIGTSRWTLYKTLSSLIDQGLVEKTKRGVYDLTFMGKILANILRVEEHE